MGDLKLLEYLDLNDNPISELKGLGNLKNLKGLQITGTRISNNIIKDLGGIDADCGEVFNTQAFVEYCERKRSEK